MTWDWAVTVPLASLTVALASMCVAFRSSRTARRSLQLATKMGQIAYESTKATHAPSVSLFLTEFQCRRATARTSPDVNEAVARIFADQDSNSLEVVIRGRLINHLQQEILLTCRDHPLARRSGWDPQRNEGVFVFDGKDVMGGTAILPAGKTITFEWFDRKTKEEWIGLRTLFNYNPYDPHPPLPQLGWLDKIVSLLRWQSFYDTRLERVCRSGFRLICEPRTAERVATVWWGEVFTLPVKATVRDKDGRLLFHDNIEKISGPLDDSIVHYRVRFDSTLAQLDPPKWRIVPGRL